MTPLASPQRPRGAFLISFLAASVLSAPLQAQELIAYEPFDYSPGDLWAVQPQPPASTGVSEFMHDPETSTHNPPGEVAFVYFTHGFQSGSIAYQNLPTQGNQFDINGGGQPIRILLDTTAQGAFSGLLDGDNIGADGQTLYVSFVYEVGGPGFNPASSQSVLTFRDSSGAGRLDVGQEWQSGNFTAGPSTLFAMDNEPHLIVLKFEFAAGNDTLTVYADPPLGTPEASLTPTAGPVTGNYAFSEIYVNSFDVKGDETAQTNQYVMDELRFAATFDAATGGLLSAPPADPSDLAAVPASTSEIDLSWTDNAANETGYRVYRSLQPDSGFAQIAELAADSTTYGDSGLTDNTTFYYEVVSYNANGESAPATANATTLPEGLALPSAPSGLTAVASSATQIDLSWTNNATDAYGLRIYRSIGDDTDFRELVMLDSSVSSFTDRFAPSDRTLYYLVRAFNDLGESRDSNIASDATGTAPLIGDTYVWWEAEGFDSTNFPAGGSSWLSPQDEQQEDAASGGDVLAFSPADASDFDFEAVYTVQVPETGTYNFYARRTWNYGPITFEWGDGQTGSAPPNLARLNELPYQEFFPLNWVNLGAFTLQAGTNTLTIRLRASDWPAEGTDTDGNGVDDNTRQGLYDAFLLSQLPFSPSGKLRPGQTLGLANEGMFPWEPGFDAHTEEALLDMSYLNEDRAGETGFITRDGDKFYKGNGERIRFWATNLGGSEDFPSLSLQARFFAKRGLNMVRWHSGITDQNPFSDSINNVNENAINSVHATVAAFAEEGIYTKVSFFFILNFRIREQWGFEGYTADWIAANDVAPFGVMFYNERFIEAKKAWINALMTSPNPYVPGNTPLTDEPAVSIVEITNEDNLFFFTFTPDNVPPEQWDVAEESFGGFLIAKYGSLAAAVQAWGGGERAGDEPDEGRMELQSAGALRITDPETPPNRRKADQVEWMAQTQRDFFQEIHDYYVNDLGGKHVMTATNWRTAYEDTMRDLEMWTYKAGGVMDLHNYLEPAASTTQTTYDIRVGDTYWDASATLRPSRVPLAYKQLRGHPSVISEFAWVNPTKLESEGPLMVSSYGSLGDVDCIIWFTTNDLTFTNRMDRWAWSTPSSLGQSPATSLAYRQFYIDDAPTVVLENRTLATMYELEQSIITQGTGFDSTRDSEFEPLPNDDQISMTAALVGRVEVDYGLETDFIAQAVDDYQDTDAQTITSMTEELVMDYGNGVFTTDTPMIQGASGLLGQQGTIDLSDVSLELENAIGAVTVVSLDAIPLAQSGKVLVQTGSWDAPYGYEETSVPVFVSGQSRDGFRLDVLGGAPVGVEYIRGEVLLKGYAGATVTYLDGNGYPLATGIGIDEGQDLRVILPSTSIYTVVQRSAPADTSPVITSKALDTAFVGQAYTETLTAQGGDGALTWTAVDALPDGLTLASDGTVSGTPESEGAFTFTAQVEDADGDTDQQIVAVLAYSGAATNTNPFVDLPLEANQSKISPWFGTLWDNTYPYIWSQNHEWLFMVALPSGIYIYDLRDDLRWLFTSESLYPWIYSYEHDLWFYFFVESGIGGAPRWFYDGSGTLGDPNGYFRIPAED